MITRLRRALRSVGEFFELIELEPTRLNCECVDDGARYVCLYCCHTACEQHRSDPHACMKENVDAG